jgi:16S rRNA processing protein RimM
MAIRRARSLNDRRSTAAGVRPRSLIRQTADGLLRVGYIAGSHGLHGALRVRTDNPDSTTLGALERLFVETATGRREFKVLSVSALGGGHQRVVLEGIDDADAAQALRGGAVMVTAADLPPLKEGEFYYFQIAGAEVILTDGRRLGTIEDIMPTGGHDVWVVRDGQREVLVPVIADVVKAMDLEARRVTIEAVPGLLD